jgi:F-type H+-transporting ATPase subunit b
LASSSRLSSTPPADRSTGDRRDLLEKGSQTVKHLAATSLGPLAPDLTELIIGAIAFLIVFALLARVLMPRIQKTLQERTDAIEGGLKRAEDAQAEAARVLKQYQDQLAEARHEASRLREEAKEQGAQIIAEMREQAQAEARRVAESAQAQLETDRQQAITSLRAEVGALAMELASRIVGEALKDEARQQRTVDRFLAQLEEQSSSTSGAKATS